MNLNNNFGIENNYSNSGHINYNDDLNTKIQAILAMSKETVLKYGG